MIWKPKPTTFAMILFILVALTVTDIVVEIQKWGHATPLRWAVLAVWLFYIAQSIGYRITGKHPFI